MKKLIMFVMVLAMASSSLGEYEGDLVDVRPEIDTSGGVTTAVFDFAMEPERMNDFTGETNPAACIDPDVGYYMMPIFDDGEWADGVLSSSIWYSVEVPEGGDYVTIRVQCHIAEGEDPTEAPEVYEPQLQDCVPTEVDECNFELQEDSNWEYPDNANAAIWQETFARSDWTETIVAAGGYLPWAPYVGLIVDVIVHDTEEPPSGERESECFVYSGPKNPLVVDPNVMLVYETGETIGDFDVSLKFPPVGQGPGNQGTPYTITVTIDPNGGNGGWGASAEGEKDIQLLAGQGADNQITLTFNTANWNVPQTILFKALDDSVAEPPELIEINKIGVTITSTVAEPNLNGDLNGDPWTKPATAQVMDNDQANILFTATPWRKNNPKIPVTGPVQLWEEPFFYYVSQIKWRNIGVTVQVPPLVGGDPCQPSSVKLQAVVEGEVAGDNFPPTVPTLPYQESDDPNGMIFTAANYNVSQTIQIWGNDDAVLQVEGAEGEGDENCQANLVVTVIDDGGDSRYTDLERIVTLDIEDNECGAYGILRMDVSNLHYITDPNWAEGDPDCYVDIYDVI